MNYALELIESACFLITVVFLALASYSDLKTREVSDNLWLIYGPIGVVLTILRFTFQPASIVPAVVSIAITTLLALGMVHLGLFGGADAKAIICLGLTIPLTPVSYSPLMGYVHPFFPIVVIIMGYVSSLSIVLWLGLKNLMTLSREGLRMFQGLRLEPRWKKALAFVTGYPADWPKLESTFYLYPMEEVSEDPSGAHRRFRLFARAEADRNEMISDLSRSLTKVGTPDTVWVTPGIPMLLFILLGVVITLIIGDPIFYVVLSMAKR